MKKISNTKVEKQELNFTIICLMIICICCLLLCGLNNFIAYTDIANNNGTIWEVLPNSITLVVMAICSILIGIIIRNARHGLVFTNKNANLLYAIGMTIEANGLIQGTLPAFTPVNHDEQQIHMFFILIGVFFLFIGSVFKLGIRMKEEQDLTI